MPEGSAQLRAGLRVVEELAWRAEVAVARRAILEQVDLGAYIVTAIAALYLNVFVGVVQAFQKIPLLQALAPTQSEPPFLEAQVAVLVLVAAFGFLALKRFRPAGQVA